MPRFRFEEIAVNSTAKKKPAEEDKYTYLGLEHLDSGNLKVSRFGSDVAPIGEKLIMKKGDVLFGKRRAYQKKVAIAPFDGIFSAHGMVLRPNEAVVDKEYFPLFISSDYFLDAAIKISVGSLSPTINWGTLKDLEFDLPDIKEQRKLAAILWAANETKEAYKNLLSLTDDLVKSQFIEMFGKNPVSTDFHEYISAFQAGKSLAGGKECINKVLNTGSVSYDCFNHSDVKNLPIDYEPHPAHKVTDGDVLISRMNTLELVGAAAYVWKVDENTYVPDRIWKAIIRNDNNPIFVWQLLIQSSTKDRIRNIAGGTSGSMKNISQDGLLRIRVIKADIELQNQFAEFVQQADKSKFELQQTITSLENTMKSLMFQHIR